ncbi:MAG TPA: GyrI-like domain-containing protein [Candidatus Limnocylindrales bacterium]
MTQTLEARAVGPQVVELEERMVAVVRIVGAAAELPALLGEAFEAAMRQIATSGGQVAGPPFARYLALGPTIEAEVGFPFIGRLIATDLVREAVLPGGHAVLATHVGPYGQIGEAWRQIEAWIRQQGLAPAEAPWESYLTGPDDPGEPVTQIVFPVR